MGPVPRAGGCGAGGGCAGSGAVRGGRRAGAGRGSGAPGRSERAGARTGAICAAAGRRRPPGLCARAALSGPRDLVPAQPRSPRQRRLRAGHVLGSRGVGTCRPRDGGGRGGGERSDARESGEWEAAGGRGGAEPAETHPQTPSLCRATCLGPSLVAKKVRSGLAPAPRTWLVSCCYCLSLSLCLVLCLCHLLRVSVRLLSLFPPSVFLPLPTPSISLSLGLSPCLPLPTPFSCLSVSVSLSLSLSVAHSPSFSLRGRLACSLSHCLSFLSLSAPMSTRPCFCRDSACPLGC